MDLPQDPFILLSYINTKLRDEYAGLDELCTELDIDKDSLMSKLGDAGFTYMPEINQFR